MASLKAALLVIAVDVIVLSEYILTLSPLNLYENGFEPRWLRSLLSEENGGLTAAKSNLSDKYLTLCASLARIALRMT